ncbi:hypothetical protein SCUCBS95973_000261 [Sporothrix curviconia]|uniref:Xylanolytic transcriptional activator regulatory domain-containing protein n=1 Tax=Sporothrix curviconia TaxID=1260050 RepID=A0ABP0ANQ7_9PEZI
MADGQAPCTRCKKRGLSCTVNRSLQMLLESDTTWKYAMEKKMRRLEAIVSAVAKDSLSPATLQLVQEQPAEDQPSGRHFIQPEDAYEDDQLHADAPDQTRLQDDGHEQTATDTDRNRAADQGANHWDIVMDLESGPGAMPGFYISETPPSGTDTSNSRGVANPHTNIATRQQTATNSNSTNTTRHASNARNGANNGDNSTLDFISRGIVPLDRAQAYFDNYHNRMDHFPYRILCDHGPVSLTRLRPTSPLLVAAVCSVGALHTYDQVGGATDFTCLYAEFVALCSRKAMSKACTMDDVRGLCIGAFWLGGDLSWSLVGAAVRMATELQLYRSFRRALAGKEQTSSGASNSNSGDSRLHYLRTRLWYLVYVCDHHFSVVYGRPPLTREDESIRDARRFTTGPHATEDDARLVSQVLRWSLLTNIFDTFGVDVTRALTDDEVPHLRRFGLALDSLRAEWVDRFRPNPHVGNYPRKGVMLQYNFAKLYLYSHAFRGLPEGDRRDSGRTNSADTPTFTPNNIPTVASSVAASNKSSMSGVSAASVVSADAAMDLDEAANAGVLAALSILRAVVSDTEIQSYLDGLPIYFHVMIAFAAVFLLKVASQFASSVLIHAQEIQSLVVTLVATLKRISRTMHPRHLLSSITKGIESLLQRSGLVADDRQAEDQEAAASAELQPSATPPGETTGPGSSTIIVQTGAGTATEDVSQAVREAHSATDECATGQQHDAVFANDQDWLGHGQPDPYFMGDYDFLMNQDMDFDMQFGIEP